MTEEKLAELADTNCHGCFGQIEELVAEVRRLQGAYAKLRKFAEECAIRAPFSDEWLAELKEIGE